MDYIYTWEFRFNAYDRPIDKCWYNDATQFCSEREDVAINWFETEFEDGSYAGDYEVERVYDADDAEYYGDEYGAYIDSDGMVQFNEKLDE